MASYYLLQLGFIYPYLAPKYRKFPHECNLGVNLDIDHVLYVASDTLALHQI